MNLGRPPITASFSLNYPLRGPSSNGHMLSPGSGLQHVNFERHSQPRAHLRSPSPSHGVIIKLTFRACTARLSVGCCMAGIWASGVMLLPEGALSPALAETQQPPQATGDPLALFLVLLFERQGMEAHSFGFGRKGTCCKTVERRRNQTPAELHACSSRNKGQRQRRCGVTPGNSRNSGRSSSCGQGVRGARPARCQAVLSDIC